MNQELDVDSVVGILDDGSDSYETSGDEVCLIRTVYIN
jgi:hypothetical protein